MDRDADILPSSPTISSLSSSSSSDDLDTESTGSFFPDRSTTLGTLMGVTFPHEGPTRTIRTSSPRERNPNGGGRRRLHREREPGWPHWRWWRLCRDEAGPTSLAEFLKVERRSTTAAEVEDGSSFFSDGGGGGGGGGRLFENGRVLPPPVPAEKRRRERVSELLAGICNGVNS